MFNRLANDFRRNPPSVMFVAPEALRSLVNELSVSKAFAIPARTIFDSIYTPMNVWRKQFTSPQITVHVRMPERFRIPMGVWS